MFYVYILQSNKNKELYIGYTSDLRKRIKEHNQGLNFSTKRYMPWKIIYYDTVKKNPMLCGEKIFKNNTGGRLIKRRIKDYLYKSSSILSKDNSLQDKSKNLIN